MKLKFLIQFCGGIDYNYFDENAHTPEDRLACTHELNTKLN